MWTTGVLLVLTHCHVAKCACHYRVSWFWVSSQGAKEARAGRCWQVVWLTWENDGVFIGEMLSNPNVLLLKPSETPIFGYFWWMFYGISPRPPFPRLMEVTLLKFDSEAQVLDSTGTSSSRTRIKWGSIWYCRQASRNHNDTSGELGWTWATMKKCSVGENSRSVFACLKLPIPIWIGDIPHFFHRRES